MHSIHPRAATLALALAACSGARTPPPPAAPPVIDAGAVAVARADVPATPPPDPAREAVLAAWSRGNLRGSGAPRVVAGPIDCADAGQPARVAAVVASEGSATLVVTPVPAVEGRALNADISFEGTPEESIAGLSARDVNGDGRRDLAVFVRREVVLEGYAPIQRFMQLFSVVTDGEGSLAPMVRAEIELLGVRDDSALAAALPSLGAFEPPSDGLSPARFIARLRYATPAQFRAAVAPSGLRLCTDFPDRTGNRRKRCVTHPAARLTDALVTGRIRRDLGQFADIFTDDASALAAPYCARREREVHCGANVGGPAGNSWSLVGEGAAMRLVEISPWAESS